MQTSCTATDSSEATAISVHERDDSCTSSIRSGVMEGTTPAVATYRPLSASKRSSIHADPRAIAMKASFKNRVALNHYGGFGGSISGSPQSFVTPNTKRTVTNWLWSIDEAATVSPTPSKFRTPLHQRHPLRWPLHANSRPTTPRRLVSRCIDS